MQCKLASLKSGGLSEFLLRGLRFLNRIGRCGECSALFLLMQSIHKLLPDLQAMMSSVVLYRIYPLAASLLEQLFFANFQQIAASGAGGHFRPYAFTTPASRSGASIKYVHTAGGWGLAKT